jgi:hypothetical protein
VVSLSVLTVPLVAAATAYACTSVATLSESPGAALAGSSVMIHGAFYGVHNPADATTAGPVEIRLGSLSGPVLATATPAGQDNSFDVQIPIPQGTAAGDTFFVATQYNADGTPVYGTPARQVFTVTAPPTPAPPLFGPVIFTPPTTFCVVPSVKGKSASVAKHMLRAAHCGVGAVTQPKSKPHKKSHHTYKLVVASAGLSAGATKASGTKVSLRLRWV